MSHTTDVCSFGLVLVRFLPPCVSATSVTRLGVSQPQSAQVNCLRNPRVRQKTFLIDELLCTPAAFFDCFEQRKPSPKCQKVLARFVFDTDAASDTGGDGCQLLLGRQGVGMCVAAFFLVQKNALVRDHQHFCTEHGWSDVMRENMEITQMFTDVVFVCFAVWQ